MSAKMIILAEYRESHARVEIPLADPFAVWWAWANFWTVRK